MNVEDPVWENIEQRTLHEAEKSGEAGGFDARRSQPRGGFLLMPARNAEAVDRIIFPAVQGGPFMHTIAAKAV